MWSLVIRPSRQSAGWSANDGKATDGQTGGRFGHEGPETVVLRNFHRGAEAALWNVNLMIVNLMTGQRVQHM